MLADVETAGAGSATDVRWSVDVETALMYPATDAEFVVGVHGKSIAGLAPSGHPAADTRAPGAWGSDGAGVLDTWAAVWDAVPVRQCLAIRGGGAVTSRFCGSPRRSVPGIPHQRSALEALAILAVRVATSRAASLVGSSLSFGRASAATAAAVMANVALLALAVILSAVREEFRASLTVAVRRARGPGDRREGRSCDTRRGRAPGSVPAGMWTAERIGLPLGLHGDGVPFAAHLRDNLECLIRREG